MKKILFIITLALAVVLQAKSQNIINHSPAGFDTPRNEIKKGKVDSIIYYSKTVGTKRKALVYTPPSYTRTKNIRYCIFYMELVAMKENGLKGVSLRLFWITCMPKINYSQ